MPEITLIRLTLDLHHGRPKSFQKVTTISIGPKSGICVLQRRTYPSYGNVTFTVPLVDVVALTDWGDKGLGGSTTCMNCRRNVSGSDKFRNHVKVVSTFTQTPGGTVILKAPVRPVKSKVTMLERCRPRQYDNAE